MFNKIIKVVLILFFSSLAVQAVPKNPKGHLKGNLIDLETRLPLIGANIYIKDSNIGSTTDENGEYFMENLDAGTYVVIYSYLGYETATKTDVIIRPGRTSFLNVELKSSVVEMENVVVESGYFTEIENKPVSTINFSSEEIRRAPGSAGDVSRILFGLPSLAKVNDQHNSLIVRGGSPVENTFYLDNIEIPNINHFPVQGSSDGPIGLLNVDFIEDVNFYSGGFSAIYGDRLSSIMELDYREGNKDKFEPQLNMSLAGFGGSIEGPLGSKGNYMLAVNKSYLDLILDENETGGAMPNYGDVQGKLVYNLNDKHKLTILELMSYDEINLKYEHAIDSDVTNVYGKTDGITNVAGLNWQYVWKDNGYSNTSLSHTYMNFDRDYSETKSQRQLVRNTSIESQIKLRNVNYLKIDKVHSLEFGVEATASLNKFDYRFEEWQDNFGNITPSLEIDKDLNTLKAGLFGVHHMQLTDKLKIDLGARADYFDLTDVLNISPRFSFTYSLGKKTSLNGSVGLFHQEIPNYILSQNDAFKNLKTPLSRHYVLGISQNLGESARLSIEGYYKDYKNFPIDPAQPTVFLYDQVSMVGIFLNHENLVDEGIANSKGVEVLLQKKLAKDFYGMVAASYSKAKYRDLNGDWHSRIYDNEFNFTLEGGYIPNDEWEFKLRWIYAGGAPYTPFDIEASKANQKGIWDINKTNSKRLPDYHSLNVRVDKRFFFNNSNMIVYLSIWNAYGRENVAQYVWNETENKLDVQKQWSTLPVLGIEFEF